MPFRRAPWWMYIVAGSFVGFVALFFYQLLFGPPPSAGLEAKFESGGALVLSVHPGSAEARAGLAPGDRILTIDGRPLQSGHDWETRRANTEVGVPQRWLILRGGQPRELVVSYPRVHWKDFVALGPTALWGLTLFLLTSLALGLLVAFRRPRDPKAMMGAWVLLTASAAFGFPDGWAAAWRHLPVFLSSFLWIPGVSRLVPDAILLSFFAVFPARIFRARWPWLLIWAPALALFPWRAWGIYGVIYRPETVANLPQWVLTAISLRSAAFVLASLLFLGLNYHRLADANQRRRVRVLLAGMALSVAGVVIWVAIGASRMLKPWQVFIAPFVYMSFLVFPLSFTYAILRHRLFDVGVLIRQGLQYAVARGVLLSLVPLLGAILFADAFLHGEQPLIAILASRGWIYAAVGGLAVVAHTRRARWLDALDRRFFRERYDAQRLLREVVDDIRQAGTLEGVAPRVTARIEAALHAEFAALLIRAQGESSYRSLAAAPAGQAPLPLSAESKLIALMRVLNKPLEMPHSESGWLQQQLPPEEVDFLRHAQIDLLVPVSGDSGGPEALLALGIKKSEEPYGQEDLDLLMAIGSGLAMILERPAAPVAPSVASQECPECGTCYDSGARSCPQEGASLVPIRLPRLLAGRYRLDRRRGRGGMGTVYEATDTALERRVAVKVIRDDLVESLEAAERFRCEARAAAAFTHPNVVTVHDFGLVQGMHAFLVMELLEGTTLRERLRHEGRIGVPRTLEILRGVCAAVEVAHRKNLIHCDLKPENIFLADNESGEVSKVLDFGIAKFLPGGTQTIAAAAPPLIGTVWYMTPEHLRGEPANPAWDLWGLAVTAYEMLTGAYPFAGAGGNDFDALLTGRFTPLSAHRPGSPSPWQDFFVRAFDLEPTCRPTTAGVFFSGLERALLATGKNVVG